MEVVAVTEKKGLKMHPKLLLDVIKRQAGTLEKAILEGTMNSIEAGASKVDINFKIENNKAFLSIYDDGIGISTEQELVYHFETFGTPHEETEGKIWAQFRMGRGQMFAFGYNTWRTSTFKMEVDVNNMGLTYHLTKKQKEVDGCRIDIELYENPIGSWACPSIIALKGQVRKQIEHVSTAVYFNGEQINTPPEKIQWDYEDENAYYKFHIGNGLRIYNLGAYVKEIDTYRSGVNGLVISKKMLEVNFARNDIQSTCKVYKQIQKVVKSNVKDKVKPNRALSDNERYAILFDILNGVKEWYDVKGKRIFLTPQKKWLSLNMIMKSRVSWTFAPLWNRTADKAMEQGTVMCLAEDILDHLDYRGEKKDFFEWLLPEMKSLKNFVKEKQDTYIDFSELKNIVNTTYVTIPKEKWTIREKRIVKILELFYCWKDRDICIGEADSLAWTNGVSYIVLNRGWLRKLNLKKDFNITRLFVILTHELAHDDSTEGTDIHGEDFYERFHEITLSCDNPLVYMLRFKEKIGDAKLEEYEERTKKQLGIDISAA